MATSLKPLGDRVIVKPKAKEEMTKSGLVLPDTASEKPQEGSVLSVGPGRVLDNGKRVEMEVKSGDTVLFAKYAGTEVKLDGEEYLVIRESDLQRSSRTARSSFQPLAFSFQQAVGATRLTAEHLSAASRPTKEDTTCPLRI